MGEISASEQYLIELVNGLRASLGRAALAPRSELDDAASSHNQWMLATGTFSHTGAGASSSDQRMAAAGYPTAGGWTSGENIAARSLNASPSLQDDIDALHQQWVTSSGHYANLIRASFTEIGVGLDTGSFTYQSGGTSPSLMGTQNFAANFADQAFLTGVWFDDADGDRAYDIGEGLGGATVSARNVETGAVENATTWSGGGYALQLGAGTYEVTFAFQGRTVVRNATIGFDNVKLDLDDLPSATVTPGVLYVASFVDLAAAFSGTMVEIEAAGAAHRDGFGRAEGRTVEGHHAFDAGEYRANYADLAALDDAAVTLHWINTGVVQGRLGYDASAYIASHADLIAAFGADEAAAVAHYQAAGRAEGRSITFDARQYLDNYADLNGAFGGDVALAARHFVADGHREGRTDIDPLDYVASHLDLIQAFGDPGDAAQAGAMGLAHFTANGRAEGRTVTFDAWQYLENYADLRAAFGDDVDAAAQHFIAAGFYEGRTDDDLTV